MITESPFYRALIAIFSGTLVVQAIGLARQVAFAAYFGADRSVDLYLLVVAIAAFTVFIFQFVIESGAIAPLVAARDKGLTADVDRLASGLFVASIGLSFVLCGIFLLAVPLIAPIVAAGVTAAERASMAAMSWYLVPWILCVLPFYALSANHKARRNFSRFLVAEVLVTLVSLIGIVLWHPNVETAALAYGAGYVIGLLSLLPGAGIRVVAVGRSMAEIRTLALPMLQLTGSTAIASLGSIADRFVQSFLPAGGIAAASYSGLLVSNTLTLLGFRDIFLVPFAEPNDRAIKLERALIGLSMLAIPAAVLIATEAMPIVQVLLQRGKFDANATAQTVELLRIQSLTLLSGALASPMFRMLQATGRINSGSVVFLVSSVATLLFGVVFVLGLDGGLTGYAIAMALVSYATMLTCAVFVARAGIKLDWLRIGRYVAYSLVAAMVAAGLARTVPAFDPTVVSLAVRVTAFSAVVAVAYALIYRRLAQIIRLRLQGTS